jgi:hypothetical protein
MHIIVVILVCSVLLVVGGGLYVVQYYLPKMRQYSRNDHSHKSKYGIKHANEEFSEVRYLTGDDELDFTLAVDH